jgi:hypothetical protein
MGHDAEHIWHISTIANTGRKYSSTGQTTLRFSQEMRGIGRRLPFKTIHLRENAVTHILH